MLQACDGMLPNKSNLRTVFIVTQIFRNNKVTKIDPILIRMASISILGENTITFTIVDESISDLSSFQYAAGYHVVMS